MKKVKTTMKLFESAIYDMSSPVSFISRDQVPAPPPLNFSRSFFLDKGGSNVSKITPGLY